MIDFLSHELTGTSWKITTEINDFKNAQSARINYSNVSFDEDVINIAPAGLLFEQGIRQQHIAVALKENTVTLFSTGNGFDIFSAIFYLLSRYEEYLPHLKDKYGRFSHENAIARKENFYNKPIINIWIKKLKETIAEKYPDVVFKKNTFLFLPTYDIDMAWSYKHKGFIRNTANLLKDSLQFKFTAVKSRLNVLNGIRNDPYDKFSWLNFLHEKYNLKPYYFFLVAENRSRYDKNISPHCAAMKSLIADTAIRYPIGLHPSFKSNAVEKLLPKEQKTLSNITGTTIVASRQHYLMLTLPQTYRALISAGIKYDFSMGFSGINGFRASVALPFKWYDLEKEQSTELTIFPFCFMDATSIYYQKNTPQQALATLQQLYAAVKEVNGFFSMIWHNTTLSNEGAFKGYKELYETFLSSVN